jgi:hypothetical protein
MEGEAQEPCEIMLSLPADCSFLREFLVLGLFLIAMLPAVDDLQVLAGRF